MQLAAYQIDAVLGKGSGTRVYAARDAAGARVLLKVFEAAVGQADPRARRDREAAAHRLAQGTRVPVLVSVGEDAHAGPYMVTRFEEGVSLRALLVDGPLLLEHATAAVGQLAAALAALHERGLVHGDVKPEHVLVAADGTITLLDLGLACEIGSQALDAAVTSRGTRSVSGTLGYIAPECFESPATSTAVDVFALGVIFHECLVGTRPFRQTPDGRTVGERAPIHALDARVDEATSALVLRCLALSPGERPSARAVDAAIDDTTEPPSRAERLRALREDAARARRDAVERALKRLVAHADAQVAEGDAFAATRTLDRALAYAPDDPSVLAALERVMSAPPRPAPRPRRSRALALVSLALALGALGWAAWWNSHPRPAVHVVTDPPRPPAPIRDFLPLPSARIPNATLVQGAASERRALRVLDARLRERPHDVEARLRRAERRRALGRLRDAHTDLLYLLDAHPDDARVLRALVALYDRLGESARTAPLLERIVARAPRDVDALTDLSIAHGEGPRAEAAIDRAYALAPRDPRVLARRCSLAVHGTVEPALATDRCDEAVRRAARDPFVLADRAEAALRGGDLTTAGAMLDAAIALRPEDPELYFRRADLESRGGDAAAAAATRARACRFGPDARCAPGADVE